MGPDGGLGPDSGLTARLAAVFRDALELDGSADVESLTYRSVKGWDSVGHMALVAAIEDAFGVELDADQVIDLSSFAIARRMLADMGVDDGSPG